MHQLCFDFAVPRGRAPVAHPCVRCRRVGRYWTADCHTCRQKRLARPGGAARAPVPVLERVPCSTCQVRGYWRNGDQCSYCRKADAQRRTRQTQQTQQTQDQNGR